MLLVGCTAGDHGASTLPLDFAGCDSLIGTDRCLLAPDGLLTVWVPVDADAITVQGGRIVSRTAIQGGERVSIRPASLPATLTITLDQAAGPVGTASAPPAGARWRLALQNAAVAEPSLHRARQLRWQRQMDHAIAELDRVPKARSETAATYREYWSGLLALRDGRTGEAVDRLGTAARQFQAQGRVLEQTDATVLAVHALLDQRRYAEADVLLDSLQFGDSRPFLAAYLVDYYRGALASYVGNLRGALQSLSSAVAHAEQFGETAKQRLAEQWLALQLQAVGRGGEADALLTALSEDETIAAAPCVRAQLQVNTAWNRLLSLESGQPAADPKPLLTSALATYARDCDAVPDDQANARINLALAHVHGGDADAAARELSRLELDALPVNLRLWSLDIEARVALLQGHGEAALERYDTLSALADTQFDEEAQWRAVVGRARTLEFLGRNGAALAAFTRAEALLERQTLQVPIHAGRETFIARREWATRRHLELLLGSGDAPGAFEVARRARARVLTTLRREDRLDTLTEAEQKRWFDAMQRYTQARERLAREAGQDWRLPADELARTRERRRIERREIAAQLDAAFAMLDRVPASTVLPARRPGESVLLYYPLDGGTGTAGGPATASRWAAFAQSERGTDAKILDCIPPAGGFDPLAAADCLLEPFAAHLESPQHIRVLPAGPLQDVDFHALPWRGASLVATAPVTFGLDLPPHDRLSSAPATALIVGDPRGDLPAARREARSIDDLLSTLLEDATATLLGDDADLPSIRRELERTDLFHYAGHAVFGGSGGWSSMLPLAGDASLGVGDILALRRSPDLVVLSGCETARAADGQASQGIGIAHAFLAAGSNVVLAAARPVEDDLADALINGFYAHWREGASPAQALGLAQLALSAGEPARDWFSFRLMQR
jgi:hypothetical protein